MSFKFEKLIIWQKAMDFGEDINSMTLDFPKKEMYNLSSQIMRATDSIALNIAEGSIEQSSAEFNRFLGYSLKSNIIYKLACRIKFRICFNFTPIRLSFLTII